MQTRQIPSVMARLNDTSPHRATPAIIAENYDSRVYGKRQRYAMPSALTSVDGVDRTQVFQNFTYEDFTRLKDLVSTATCPLDRALIDKINSLDKSTYAQAEFDYNTARGLESYLASQNNDVEMTDKQIQATQENPLAHPKTLDTKLVVNKNAASSQAHAVSIRQLINKLATEFYSTTLIVFSDEAAVAVDSAKATNLSRMVFFDKQAIYALCCVYGVDKAALTDKLNSKGMAVTLAEIRAARTQEPEIKALAIAIETLFEAAYFGSGRAFQSLIEAHEAGIYEFSDEELCQLVEAQMAWYRIGLAAQTPRDGNRVHYVAYPFADDLSAVQCLPDLILSPKTWKAVRVNQAAFQNLLANVYHQQGIKASALVVANEHFDEEVKLSNDDLRQLLRTLVTLYIAAKQSGSSVEGDDMQILPRFLPEKRYPRLWEALRGKAEESYRLLNDFWPKLSRELLNQPVVAELTARGPRSEEERAEAAHAELTIDALVSSVHLAGEIEKQPEHLIKQLQEPIMAIELSDTKRQFAAQRIEILEAMGKLRHYALSEKLRTPGLDESIQDELVLAKQKNSAQTMSETELMQKITEQAVLASGGIYDIREVIIKRIASNQVADKSAQEKLDEDNKALQKPQQILLRQTDEVVKKLQEEDEKDLKDSSVVEYKAEKSGFAKSKTANHVEREFEEASNAVEEQAKLTADRNRPASFLWGKSDQELLQEKQQRLVKCEARLNTLRTQQAAYVQRKAQRDKDTKLVQQLRDQVNQLVTHAIEVLKNLNMIRAERLDQLEALKLLSQDILEVIENNPVVEYMRDFVEKVSEFIISQMKEANAQAVREARLQELENKERALTKALVETNPVTEFIRLVMLDYVQTWVARKGRGDYSYWKNLIAQSLQEDITAYEYGAFAFKHPNKKNKAREALPLFIVANSSAYIKLLVIYILSVSAEDFWLKIQDKLFETNGRVVPKESASLLNVLLSKDAYPITTDLKKNEESLRRTLLERYTVTNYQDPLQAMLEDNVMLDLAFTVSNIFPVSQEPQQILDEAAIIRGRIAKLVCRLESEERYSYLGDYLKVAMMMLGDNDAFSYLVDGHVTNPVFNVCLERGDMFALPDAIKFAIEALQNDDQINKSTLKNRQVVLDYLTGQLSHDARFTVLLARFQDYIAAQTQVFNSGSQESHSKTHVERFRSSSIVTTARRSLGSESVSSVSGTVLPKQSPQSKNVEMESGFSVVPIKAMFTPPAPLTPASPVPVDTTSLEQTDVDSGVSFQPATPPTPPAPPAPPAPPVSIDATRVDDVMSVSTAAAEVKKPAQPPVPPPPPKRRPSTEPANSLPVPPVAPVPENAIRVDDVMSVSTAAAEVKKPAQPPVPPPPPPPKGRPSIETANLLSVPSVLLAPAQPIVESFASENTETREEDVATIVSPAPFPAHGQASLGLFAAIQAGKKLRPKEEQVPLSETRPQLKNKAQDSSGQSMADALRERLAQVRRATAGQPAASALTGNPSAQFEQGRDRSSSESSVSSTNSEDWKP